MKFGKLLLRAEENLPDVKSLSLRYKQLKKQLKDLAAAAATQPGNTPAASCSKQELSPAEKQFIATLNEARPVYRNCAVNDDALVLVFEVDMKKFNDYFCDKEEEVVIWMQQLDEQCAAAKSLKDYQLSHIGYIHLHGQLVLLYHWSMLNYAALVKILKKHDKITGLLLKARFLSNALRQPFSTTGVLSSLMAECERKANGLNAKTGGLDSLVQCCPQYEGLFLMKETQAAFELWAELKTNVSTPSSFVTPDPKRRKVADGADDAAAADEPGASADAAAQQPAAAAAPSADAACSSKAEPDASGEGAAVPAAATVTGAAAAALASNQAVLDGIARSGLRATEDAASERIPDEADAGQGK